LFLDYVNVNFISWDATGIRGTAPKIWLGGSQCIELLHTESRFCPNNYDTAPLCTRRSLRSEQSSTSSQGRRYALEKWYSHTWRKRGVGSWDWAPGEKRGKAPVGGLKHSLFFLCN